MKKQYIASIAALSMIMPLLGTTKKKLSFMDEIRQMEQTMHSSFDAMMKQFDAWEKEMHNALSQKTPDDDATITIAEDNDTRAAIITIENLLADTVEATVNNDNDRVTINAGNHTLQLALQNGTYLTITANKETSEKKESDNNETRSLTVSCHSYGQLLSEAIDLEKTIVAYDKKKKALSITLPFVATKKMTGKKIPVTIN